jgi:histone H3/H4
MSEREALKRIIEKLMDMEYNIISVDYAISQLFEYNVIERDAFGRIDDIRRLYREIIDEIKNTEVLREIYNEVMEQRRKELIKALEEISEKLPRTTVKAILALELTNLMKKVLQKIERSEHEK